MRKFLLSTVALLMTATMLAVGNGSGSSQANAIDFDWDGVSKPKVGKTSWYSIKLSELNNAAEDPTVALYLTNLTNETANVDLTGNAILKFPFPLSMFIKDIDLMQLAGTNATEHYSIEGKKHVVWTMPTTYDLSSVGEGQAKDALTELFGDLSQVSLIQLVEYGLNVYLSILPDREIAVSADVYETAEIIDDACTKAEDFNWAGVTVTAGEKWFYLDLNAVKNTDKKLNFVVENNGAVEANVNFDLYADCPASAILLDYDWAIAAGSEVKEALGRFFLDQMTRDYVYLKLTTDQAVTLKAEEEVLPPPVELFNPSAAPVLEVGKEYVLNGETVLKVDLAALKAPKGYKTVCHIVNANGVAVNLKQEIAFSTPVTSNNVQEKNLLVEAGAALEINVPNKQVESVKSNVAYFRLTTDESLTLWMEHVKLETSKPVDPSAPSTPAILAPSCEDSYAFDWNSSVKQKALMTKWYELDITSLKKNEEHVQLSFTNHHNTVVLVMGSILLDCNSTDTIPFICPVPAGMSISKVVDYSLLATSPLGKAYMSLTMMPTSAKSLAEFASIRSQADLMNFVSMDFSAEIEVKAKRISALVDPSYCEATYQTMKEGVEYHIEPGKTHWYRVTGDFLKDMGLLEKLTIFNNGKKDANVTIGATIDCQYGIATTITQTVPSWFDVTSCYPSGFYQLARLLTKKEISEFYLSVKSDQPMLFGFGLDHGTMLGCDDAIRFDWTKGAVINSRDAQWYNFDLNTVKGSGSHLKLTFTNHSDEIVWVASAVSLTCPLKVVMPTVVPVLPGTNVDKVIDYSFVATNPINNVYVAVITEGKIELGATLIDATVTKPADCVNHIEVESGVKYYHKAGTTWYKFSNKLLANMSRAPRFTFENLSSNDLSLNFGATVDCQYGILTTYDAKIPAQVLGQPIHHREFSARIPREFFQAVRKLIDPDVTEFMLQLKADNPFSFSIDMQAEDGCYDAQEFNWFDCFDLQANQDKWFKVNVQEPLNSKSSTSLAIYNYNDFDVTIEAEVSPTCPVMLTMTESYTLEAGDSLMIAVKPEAVKSLLDQYSAYIRNMSCYARLKANGDIKVCVNAKYVPETPDMPVDPCATVDPLNWTGTISLKSLVEGNLYKLDIASLYNLTEAAKKRGIRLTIENDLELNKKATLVTAIYADCEDTTAISTSTQTFDFGTNTPRVAYANFEKLVQLILKQLEALQNAASQPQGRALIPNPTKMYLKVVELKTKDNPDPDQPCDATHVTDKAICAGESFEWRGNTYTEADTYTEKEVLSCGTVTHVLNLVVDPTPNTPIVTDKAICEGESFVWRGKSYSQADTYTETEELSCGTVTYVLNLVVDPTPNTPIVTDKAICAGESFVWRGKSYSQADTYTETEELSCGTVTYVLNLVVNPTPNTPIVTDKAICEGESFVWRGKSYSKADTYTETEELSCGTVTYVLNLTYDNTLCEPEDPCANVKELPWKAGLKLSDFSAKTWYKMYVGDVKGSNLTVNFVNDESCAATLTVAVLSECLSTTNWEEIEWESLVTRTETCALGLDTTRTVSSAIFNKYPQIDDYVYVYVESKVQDCDPCANVKELDWKAGLKLSDFSAKTWYKMYVGDVKGSNMTVNFVNDESCAATLTVAVLSECLSTTNWEDIAWESLVTRTETCALGLDTTRTVSSAIFNKYPQIDDYVYVYVESKETEKHTAYAVIKDTICDGATYVDPITNVGHVIASYEPFTLTWTSTKSVSPCVDSVYTFEITPIVAPDTITVAFLEEIGAMPKLEAGKKVDVSGTLETIQAYYDTHTSDTVAPVTKVYWTAGHEDLLDCDQTSHSMSLVVEAGCGFEVPATLTFPVTPATRPTGTKTYASTCPGTKYSGWEKNPLGEYGVGTHYFPEGDDVACDVAIDTLVVTEKTRPTGTKTYASTCPGTKYSGWEKNPSVEYGVGTHYFPEEANVDCDVAIDTLVVTEFPEVEDIVEYDTICPGETITWNGVTYATAGEHTLTLQNENGCDYQATLHLYVADADNVPEYDNLDAVGKYGDRLLLLNLNRLNELATAGTIPAVPNAANVTWYRVNGERDLIADILNGRGDDEAMPNSNSYYYNNADGSPLMAGNYYVLMSLPGAEGECPTYLRSVEVELGQSASLAPQLVPTIASPNADIRLLNLNPSAVTEIRVYNTTGDLQAVYTASEVADFMFKAATISGYYMVEVQSDGEKVTLRYIVK